MSFLNTTLPENAVWVVIGTSSKIGLSIISSLLSNPRFRVVILFCETSINCLPPTSNDSNTLLQLVDLTSSTSIADAFKATLENFQRINVVINNTEYSFLRKLESLDKEKARKLLEINFWAPVQITRHAVDIMQNINPNSGAVGGLIAKISSCGEYLSIPRSSPYVASKATLEAFTKALSEGVDPNWNIRFAIIQPESRTAKWFPISSIGGSKQRGDSARKLMGIDKMEAIEDFITTMLKGEKATLDVN